MPDLLNSQNNEPPPNLPLIKGGGIKNLPQGRGNIRNLPRLPEEVVDKTLQFEKFRQIKVEE